MNKRFRFLLLFFLAPSSFLSISNQNAYSVDAASAIYTTEKVSYYNCIDTSATTGTSLLGAIHDLTITNHKSYTSYNDVGGNGIQKIIDADPDNEGYIIEFYSQSSWPNAWAPDYGDVTGGYNREHLWCQNRSNSLWGTTGGGADMHHLRPAEGRLNSARSNHQYGVVSAHDSSTELFAVLGETKNPTKKVLGGYYQSSTFEPLDCAKGDVARILMYVYMHYNEASLIGGTINPSISSYVGNLPITNIMKTDVESEAWALLLKWNELDPVSAYEVNRNESVSKYQGNRNPFIDYPDLANCIWGDKTWDWTNRCISGSSVDDYITLNKSSISMNVSESTTLLASSNLTPSWSNSNDEVISIYSNGTSLTINALSVGTSLITATSGSVVATCKVTVNEAPFSLDKETISLKVGNSSSITSNKIASWSVSPTDIVSLSSTSGETVKITALIKGEAIVYASYGDTILSCSVSVISSSGTSIEERTLTLTASSFDSDLPSDKNSVSSLKNYKHSESGLTFGISGVYAPSGSSYFLLYNNNSVPSFICNLDSLGKIVKISFTYTDVTSEKGTTGVYFSSEVLSSYESSSNNIAVKQKGEVTEENSTDGLGYFQISSSTSNVQIVSIEISYEVYTAALFSQDFIDTISCDPSGAREPLLANWNATKVKYDMLNTVEASILKNTAANKDGEITEQAMHYYDYIIYKYGESSFTNYIGREVSFSSSLISLKRDDKNSFVIPTIVLIMVTSTSLTLYYFSRKRKRE